MFATCNNIYHKKRKCDINLGTNFRRNIKTNKTAYKLLKNNLKSNGFKTKIDLPFNGNKKTIAGSLKNEFKNLWTIQIEINSSITTQSTTKFEKLIQILSDFINNINKKMSSKEWFIFNFSNKKMLVFYLYNNNFNYYIKKLPLYKSKIYVIL